MKIMGKQVKVFVRTLFRDIMKRVNTIQFSIEKERKEERGGRERGRERSRERKEKVDMIEKH